MIESLIIPYALAGGWWFRVRGGAPPRLPRFALILGWSLIMTLPIWWLAPWWAAALVVAVTTGATSLGHGDWQDFGTSHLSDPDEYLNVIVHRLTSKRDGTLHDMIGMALSGMSYTLAPALAAAVFAGPLWLLWLPVGALKAIAYWLGWRVFGFRVTFAGGLLDHPTAVGEFLTGFLICGATGLLWWAAR